MDQSVILGLIAGFVLLAAILFFIFRSRSNSKIDFQKTVPTTATQVIPDSANRELKGGSQDDVLPVATPPVIEATVPPSVPVDDQTLTLKNRLAKSQSLIGESFRSLFGSTTISSEAWTDLEDALILSDVGAKTSGEIVKNLQSAIKKSGASDPDALKEIAKQELSKLVLGNFNRTLNVERKNEQPAVVLTVGVNGTGKTTTTGKLARFLVGKDLDVLLGAADTFRAAAAEQLITWGDRIGVPVVRGVEGSDPASVAFDAVKTGIENEVDVVLIDTAGRLHTKQGLMDELGKVHRVIEKSVSVDEVLLVIDATTGQNGLTQAKVFAEVVPLTGIVLTKLDGTAKGGIVIAVQQELGVPVKFVGLGEGPDDLAEFDPELFVAGLFN